MDDNTIRAAFERWYELEFAMTPGRNKGVYASSCAQSAWEAWQACAAIAPAVPPGWQAIETAPRTGRESLFYTEELGLVVMYWDGFEGQWATGFDECDVPTPTHWQPLPQPPQGDPQ